MQVMTEVQAKVHRHNPLKLTKVPLIEVGVLNR
jgi:hypothetical protein